MWRCEGAVETTRFFWGKENVPHAELERKCVGSALMAGREGRRERKRESEREGENWEVKKNKLNQASLLGC